MKFGSLFSGIGGFDRGFEQAGLSCSWQVEIDGDCGRVLEKHWSGVAKHKDVREVRQLESVDVICGGFPCQDLSVAGQRKGLAGERSGLWFEFLRIVGLNRPRWVVIENVPGLLSSDESRDFAAILRGLVERGYCIAWRVLDAQFYGVAQRRRRVFIVGSLGDGSSAQILFESESVSWNPPTRREAGAGTSEVSVRRAQTSSNGWGIKTDGSTGTIDGTGGDAVIHCAEIASTLNAAYANKWGLEDQHINAGAPCFVTHALRSEGADASEDGTGRGTPLVVANCFNGYTGGPDDNDAQANHLIAFSSKDHGADAGEIAPTLRSQNFDKSHINGGGQVAIAYRDDRGRGNDRALEDVTYPLHCAKGQSEQQVAAGAFGVRRLTPRECERLQGFPDDFTRYDANGKEISDSARYRMLGNAVAVPVSRWIGSRIIGREK